ncbi:unnamed protein product [Protopolystoma xenopodis]|uniref:Uncharacterized protein n=1 Tax=Protopolystoma xenopodis TaxID=117903 RepID=A0A448X9V1_9PLAT|nr:unnamed protein product [Protopolystoma xenopodis]
MVFILFSEIEEARQREWTWQQVRSAAQHNPLYSQVLGFSQDAEMTPAMLLLELETTPSSQPTPSCSIAHRGDDAFIRTLSETGRSSFSPLSAPPDGFCGQQDCPQSLNSLQNKDESSVTEVSADTNTIDASGLLASGDAANDLQADVTTQVYKVSASKDLAFLI